ncbi:MAG: hypothetical protein ACYTAS_20050 [Planctomycetota bacterium]|jgi:hypothetical protein
MSSSGGWNTSLRTDLGQGGGGSFDWGSAMGGSSWGDMYTDFYKIERSRRQSKIKIKSHKRAAMYARWEGELAQKRGAYASGKRMAAAEDLESSQRAAYGKSGVRLEGTPLLVMADEMGKAQEDAFMLRYQGRIERQRYEQQAFEHERAAREEKVTMDKDTSATVMSMWLDAFQMMAM